MYGELNRQRLNPKNTALLVIDVQKALFSRPMPIFKADDLIRSINSLIEMFRHFNALVVYIKQSNKKMLLKESDGWQFHPDLTIKANDPIIHKIHGNAFKETNLVQILESRGTKDIVITGLVTQGCVRATSIGGHELGYGVILVEDGHSNYRKDAPKVIEEWNQRLNGEYVEIISTDEVGFM